MVSGRRPVRALSNFCRFPLEMWCWARIEHHCRSPQLIIDEIIWKCDDQFRILWTDRIRREKKSLKRGHCVRSCVRMCAASHSLGCDAVPMRSRVAFHIWFRTTGKTFFFSIVVVRNGCAALFLASSCSLASNHDDDDGDDDDDETNEKKMVASLRALVSNMETARIRFSHRWMMSWRRVVCSDYAFLKIGLAKFNFDSTLLTFPIANWFLLSFSLIFFSFRFCFFFRTQNVWRRSCRFSRWQWIRYVQSRFRWWRCTTCRISINCWPPKTSR